VTQRRGNGKARDGSGRPVSRYLSLADLDQVELPLSQ